MNAKSPAAPVIESNFRRSLRARWSQYRRTWYFLRRNTLAMVGLVILLLFAAVFVYGLTYPASSSVPVEYCASDGQFPVQAGNPCYQMSNVICTYPTGSVPPAPNCYQTPVDNPNFIAPTATLSTLGAFPFGSLVYPSSDLSSSTPLFYNTYTMLVKGTVNTIILSVGIVLVGALAGLFLGALSGYYGGWVDEIVMRITDIFLSIPAILLVIAIIIVGKESGILTFNTTLLLIAIAFIIVWWPLYARIVRSQSLVVREQRYVEAARASGAGNGRIIIRHVVPNSVYPVFVQMSLDVGTIPLLLAAITFIGFVIWPYPLVPEWGSVAAAGAEILPTVFEQCGVPGAVCAIPWWQVLFPGLAIFFFSLSVNFFADGLRDALDPRLRR
jgi:ABC-type dipeptide/oligopeptide/nickel transport system permease subunit